MNSEKNVNCLVSVLLSTCISAAAVGCMVTGLNLSVTGLHPLVMICFGCAVVSSFCYRFRYGGWVLRILTLAGIYWFFQDPERWAILLEQGRVMANRMTTLWHNAYGWRVISLRAQRVCDQPLMLIGGFLAICVSRTVCRQKRATFPVLMALGPLCSCLVVTDTVPDLPWLFTLLLGFSVLILTDSVRRRDLRQGAELTAFAAAAGAVALGLLFFLCPQETYVNQTEKLMGHLVNLAQELPASMREWGQELVNEDIQTVQPQRENLSNLGDRIEKEYTVLEVTADTSTVMYLRGQDFDSYDGHSWTAGRHRVEEFGFSDRIHVDDWQQVTVTTRTAKDVRYVPYYPQAKTNFVGGRVANEEALLTYSFIQKQLPEDWKESMLAVSFVPDINSDEELALTAGLYEPATDTWRYRNLPLETKARAEEILMEILPQDGGTTSARAEAIADYVRNSAVYSLTPEKMPADAEDFAIWFLEEADSGYCIHFATATTVLLRAAGIDARYVTGYAFQTLAGRAVKVPAAQAHAWAEYFEPSLGVWVPLESTPAELPAPKPVENATEGEDVQTDITLPTRPEETTAPTVPDRPDTPETDPLDDIVRHEDDKGLKLLAGLWKTVKFLLTLALVAAAVIGQYLLRLSLRLRRLDAEEPNVRCLALWRECGLLLGLLKQEPPEELEALAQRAKFSQHTMTEAEIARFLKAIDQARQALQSRPWYWQVIYRLIFAAY